MAGDRPAHLIWLVWVSGGGGAVHHHSDEHVARIRLRGRGAGGTAADGPSPAGRTTEKDDRKRGLFARVALFVRQVVAELKKVVRPTRSELFTYTGVVLVFVLVVMAFVTVLDLGIGQLTLWVFGD